MVLPINILLHNNWVPFGTEERVIARATHLRFFAEHAWTPHPEDMEKVEHNEMEGAESVDVEDECRNLVEIERSLGRRYAEIKFVRKVEVDGAMEDEAEEATY